jgi:hypothetical protein
MDIKMKISVNKNYCNIPAKNIYWCFRLYLLINFSGRVVGGLELESSTTKGTRMKRQTA